MRKRIVIGILMCTLLEIMVLFSTPSYSASGSKEYLVMTVDRNSLKQLSKTKGIALQKSTIGHDTTRNVNLAVVEMTEQKAEALKKTDNVLYVERNVTLYGMNDSKQNRVQRNSVTDSNSGKGTVTKRRLTNKEKRYLKEEKELIKAIDNVNTDVTDQQWNLSAIHWNKNQVQGTSVKVALLDSGVNFDDDIKISESLCLIPEDRDVTPLFLDASGHGTGVAGIIAAKHNETGISGINPQAKLLSIKVLNDDNQGTLENVVEGIYAAIDSNCSIINMSFGTYYNSQILHEAIRDAQAAGILMIAAAGNKKGEVMYPAAYPEVMAVGASDALGKQIKSMASGEEIEILAPGDKILVTGMLGYSEVVKGTSASAAQVTAAASLIWGRNRNRSADFIRKLMINTAQISNDQKDADAGILDIDNALKRISIFALYYHKNEVNYPQMEHRHRNAGFYDTEGLVNGQWGDSGHEGDVDYAINESSVNSYGEGCMKLVAKNADANYSSATMIHGGGNYLAGLRYLYTAAYKLAQYGNSTVTPGQQATALTAAYNNANLDDATPSSYVNPLVGAVTSLLSTNVGTGSETSGIIKAYKVMGLAMHLVGDLNAHRVMVPSSYVQESTLMFNKSYFFTTAHNVHMLAQLEPWAYDSAGYRYNGNSDHICGYWKCFKKAVEYQLIEFRDISKFSSYSNPDTVRQAYEDNTSFLSQRYSNSNKIARRLLTFFVNEKTPMQNDPQHMNIVGLAKPQQSNVIYNGYKTYADLFPSDKNAYDTDEFWEAYSTDQIR